VASTAHGEAGSLRDARSLLALATSSVQAAAEAAREGDFIGIGGRLVSDGERAVIAAVVQALTD